MKINPDLTEAKRFLSKLDPAADSFVFQAFDDSKDRKDPQLARVIHGTLDTVAPQLIKFNQAGAGVFVTVNKSNNGGRKKGTLLPPVQYSEKPMSQTRQNCLSNHRLPSSHPQGRSTSTCCWMIASTWRPGKQL